MRLTVVGCGDAFGSGGRGSTCFQVEAGDFTFALDFGATALVQMKRLGLDPGRLDAVILSHLHGDHFGGLPFLLLNRQFRSSQERPLAIIGPPGTRERVERALEVFFPGSPGSPWRFDLSFHDLPVGHEHRVGPLSVRSFEVIHPCGAPPTALRLTDGRRVLAFSGDTSWTDALIQAADGADLYISECYRLDQAPANHLDLATIERNRERLGARRILLSHMSAAVLEQVEAIEARGYLVAHDGLVLDV